MSGDEKRVGLTFDPPIAPSGPSTPSTPTRPPSGGADDKLALRVGCAIIGFLVLLAIAAIVGLVFLVIWLVGLATGGGATAEAASVATGAWAALTSS